MLNSVYGAGLQDIQIVLPDDSTYDADGAMTAEGDPSVEEIEIPGDDVIKTTFIMAQGEDLTLTLNSVPFDVLEAITGNTVDSDATSMTIPLGTDSEQSPPYFKVVATSIAKNKDGTSGLFQKTWFKVQAKSCKITQANGTELSLEVPCKAYKTSVDIDGTTPLDVSCVSQVKQDMS